MSNDDRRKPEYSPGGSQLLRHERVASPGFEPAVGDSDAMPQLVEHVEQYYGKVDAVWHEIISDKVHIDVHVIRPTPERDHYTLFTTGMSDRAMTVPAGAEDFKYAELLMHLPSDWPMPADLLTLSPAAKDAAGKDPEWYWPVRSLKMLARFPHDFGTWLGFGHTLPNGDPPTPFVPATKLCCWMLLPPVAQPGARQLKLEDGRTVHFYVVHGLTLEEMSLKLNKGSDELLKLFAKRDYSEVLRPDRAPLTRRKLFGIF